MKSITWSSILIAGTKFMSIFLHRIGLSRPRKIHHIMERNDLWMLTSYLDGLPLLIF
jgi:hypothetical protein